MLCSRVSTRQGHHTPHCPSCPPPPHEVPICVYKLKVAPGQVDTLDIEKEKEIIGEQEIVYDEFVEEADMEDVENEENETEDDAADKDLF